jgi:hypothetical protein
VAVNFINKKSEIEVLKVADAVMTEKINETSSWILVKNKNAAEKIKQGDFVVMR